MAIMIFADINLAQKLERTEARSNASLVETRRKIDAKTNADWQEFAGAYAMFDGISSPLTQTFGLGLFEKATDEALMKIENFYRGHGASVFHEISPLADASLMPLLNERGYKPIEHTSVIFQPVKALPSLRKTNLKTRIIDEHEKKLWAKTSALGWSTEGEMFSDFMLQFGLLSAECDGGFPFLTELDDKPVATGMIFIFDDVALLAGASTIPQSRKQGAQVALLEARLQMANDRGCKIAMMCALPGSQSQRNAEKNGFRIAYTRTKWQKVFI